MLAWLCCPSQPPSRTQERPRPNWTSPDAPCAKYDELRKTVLGDIGVKIDVTGEWADGFRRALTFWNMVLAANFYEETRLDDCSIRIIYGGPDIVGDVIVARSQATDRDNFRGKIAVRPIASQELSSSVTYAAAVHEIGHMLGLKHNTSANSVMYYLGLDGTEALDAEDILNLSWRHKVRPEIPEKGFFFLEAALPSRQQTKDDGIKFLAGRQVRPVSPKTNERARGVRLSRSARPANSCVCRAAQGRT